MAQQQRRRPPQRQHETLRVPEGWNEQSRSLVIQLEGILDDIYWRLGDLREAIKNLQQEGEGE